MRRTLLDIEATEMVAEITALYIQLAEEVLSLELKEPNISMEEAVAVWITARSIKEEALESVEVTGSIRHLSSIYNGVIGSAFGSVLTDLEAVRVGTIPTLAELLETHTDVLAKASSDRAGMFVEAASNIAHISLAISKATVNLALFCLSESEKKSAALIAKSLIDSDVNLDEYVRYRAEQWISKAAWSSSESELEEE